jgi:hypothetical protein
MTFAYEPLTARPTTIATRETGEPESLETGCP